MASTEGVSYRHKSSHAASTMASSILRFNDINFVVGKGDKQKNILQDVSGKVRWGRKYYVEYKIHTRGTTETICTHFPSQCSTTTRNLVVCRCPCRDGTFGCWVSPPVVVVAVKNAVVVASIIPDEPTDSYPPMPQRSEKRH
jgi:hypothetical protein